MRDYLSFRNLGKACLLAAIMTVLTAPRISIAFPDYYPAHLFSFIALVLIGGMATAWSKSAGMVGLLPPYKKIWAGMAIATGLLIIIVPLQIIFLNPVIVRALNQLDDEMVVSLLFPREPDDGFALMLWAMSFEVIFFTAAAMSFFARLTKRLPAALICCVLLRMLVAYLKMNQIGVGTGLPLVLLMAGILSCISCMLFARYGLAAAMLLAGGLTISRWTFLWN